MLKHALLFFLLFGLASAKGENEKKANCTALEDLITLDADQHAYINCQNTDKKWGKLNITIDGGEKTSGGLSLLFNSLANFQDSKSFQIYAIGEGDAESLIYEGLPKGKLWLPTGQKKIRLYVKNDKDSAISVKVYLKCGGTFDLPTFDFPVLPNQKLPGPAVVTCDFLFTKPAIVDFTEFSLANTSKASFSGTSNKNLAGPFIDKGPDHVVILDTNSVFSLEVDLTKPDQNLTFDRELLIGDCGKDKMITVEKGGNTDIKIPARNGEVSCSWLLAASDSAQKLTLTPQNVSLQHVDDLVSVVDAGNFSGTPLLQITVLNKKTSSVISSGRYLVVSLNSKDFDPKESFGFTVSAISSGGRLYNNGTMSIQESSNFILSTGEDENLVVTFSELTTLNDSQKIVVLVDSVELVTFDAKSKLFDLTSPGSKLEVVATGFATTGVNVPFMSKPKDSGCSRTFISEREDNLRLIGSCNGLCTWIVKPIVAAEKTNIFMKILPNNVPTGSITHFRNKDGKVDISNSADPFIVSYQVKDGAWIDFDCSNAKDFEMSYITKSENQDLAVTAVAGQNFTLTSPFFPGIYPLGGKFAYKVTVPDTGINYLASFRIMDLLPNHTLSIGSKGSTFELRGSDLPGDTLIPASALVDVTLDTVSIPQTNPEGGYGFHISLAPTSSSQTLKEASKTITTGEKCSTLRCVYIIDLPKPADVNASVSVNLTVTFPANGTLKDSDLLVWDGESVLREKLIAPIANLTKGGLLVSRSNKVIVVYQGALNLTLSYVASPCSYAQNTMCLKERLCMPWTWRCDSELHCSDGSDEFQCRNGLPPNPTPGPAPSTSSGWKVAFWLFMPLFILLGVALTKGVPVLVQRFRDSRYHQFHDLGDH